MNDLRISSDSLVTIKTKWGWFKEYPEAIDPKYATSNSACMDVSACLRIGDVVDAWTEESTHYSLGVCRDGDSTSVAYVTVQPWSRILIPTGLIFDIPDNMSLRLHPRSGLSIKSGLTLVNAEGVIDSDYVQQTKIPLINLSSIPVRINHGDRVCQMEIVPRLRLNPEFVEISERPTRTVEHGQGFGSTGR